MPKHYKATCSTGDIIFVKTNDNEKEHNIVRALTLTNAHCTCAMIDMTGEYLDTRYAQLPNKELARIANTYTFAITPATKDELIQLSSSLYQCRNIYLTRKR